MTSVSLSCAVATAAPAITANATRSEMKARMREGVLLLGSFRILVGLVHPVKGTAARRAPWRPRECSASAEADVLHVTAAARPRGHARARAHDEIGRAHV